MGTELSIHSESNFSLFSNTKGLDEKDQLNKIKSKIDQENSSEFEIAKKLKLKSSALYKEVEEKNETEALNKTIDNIFSKVEQKLTNSKKLVRNVENIENNSTSPVSKKKKEDNAHEDNNSDEFTDEDEWGQPIKRKRKKNISENSAPCTKLDEKSLSIDEKDKKKN